MAHLSGMIMAFPPTRWLRQRMAARDEPDASGGSGESSDVGSSVPASGSTRVEAAERPPARDRPGRDRRIPPADRSAVIGSGIQATARWSARLLLIGLAAAGLYWLLGAIWVGLRPILLAVIVSTVLWPPVAWLRRHRWPKTLAAATVVVGALLVVGGVLYATARPIVGQTAELANSAADGLQRVQDWLSGPPLNISGERLDELITAAEDRLRSSAAEIASGVVSGVSAVSGTVITTVLVLVLAFLFVKDGPGFLPWLRRWTGPTIGGHLTEVLARAWDTLGSFIRVQALVSFVDAVLIGLGLVLLGVPLAPALAVLTFIAGFVPIVGAIAAGALAVLVALVTNGFTTALLVLGLILLVQQLESNVLQPFLQGRSLNLHAAVVLLAVTAGGTLYGIIGAFLAVPVTAVGATVLRYISEQTALRAGEIDADEVSAKTPQGAAAARSGERGDVDPDGSRRTAGGDRHQ